MTVASSDTGGRLGTSPIEEGEVKWLRDLDLAIEGARNSGKNILVLFQEVPGCATCQNFGLQVLSHPLVVEMIEEHFVPLIVHNNKPGKDKIVLERFGEPAWNNPVLRIVSPDLITRDDRLSGRYNPHEVVAFLMRNLSQVPLYTQLLYDELLADYRGTEQLVAEMYCFWSGESKIGGIDGVVQTAPGFCRGREVVVLDYDPEVVDENQLEKTILAGGMANKVMDNQDVRSDDEPQYYLRQTLYHHLPLLDIQRTKMNAYIATGKSPEMLLSKRQLEIYKRMKGDPVFRREMVSTAADQKWKYVLSPVR